MENFISSRCWYGIAGQRYGPIDDLIPPPGGDGDRFGLGWLGLGFLEEISFSHLFSKLKKRRGN